LVEQLLNTASGFGVACYFHLKKRTTANNPRDRSSGGALKPFVCLQDLVAAAIDQRAAGLPIVAGHARFVFRSREQLVQFGVQFSEIERRVQRLLIPLDVDDLGNPLPLVANTCGLFGDSIFLACHGSGSRVCESGSANHRTAIRQGGGGVLLGLPLLVSDAVLEVVFLDCLTTNYASQGGVCRVVYFHCPAPPQPVFWQSSCFLSAFES